MAVIPTLEEGDAKRPNRERKDSVGKRTSLINRMKASFVHFRIRGFNPKLRSVAARLDTARTPGGLPSRLILWQDSSRR